MTLLELDLTPPSENVIVVGGAGDGTINGIDFEAFTRVTVDPDANYVQTEILMEDIKELGNTLLASSCTSYVMSTGGIFAPALNGAQRMVDITGFPYTVAARYIHTDDAGDHVGELSQTIEVREGGASNLVLVHPHVEGWYEGPKNISHSPGYSIYLRQGAPGVIEGTYGQTLFTDDGQTVHAHVRRTYRYNTPHRLEFDQIWNYKLRKVETRKYDGMRHFISIVAASFQPAEPESSNPAFESAIAVGR